MALTALCALIVGAIAGIILDRSISVSLSSGSSGGDKLSRTISMLETMYVDSLSRDSIAEIAVPLLLGALDPHSEYIPAKDFQKMNEPLAGKFDGIGVIFNMATDTATVINVISGGPSAKVGIEAGDRIIEIDGENVAGVKKDQNAVVSMLRGVRETTVKLGVQRGAAKNLLPFTITRGEIPIASVEAEFLTKDSSAYVRVARFAATTHAEMVTALAKLAKQGAKRITLDLRGNSGGYLDQALYMADEFLPAGAMIVYLQGAHRERAEQHASGKGRFQGLPLTVLVDETSASSSEIFAGAMQDNDRATLIGRRTFGKGLIQEQVDFADGSAARITIARYYTPLGRPVQKPYTVGDHSAYDRELYDRYEHGEMRSSDSIRTDSLHIFHSPKGRVLYGGGGITPDVFVAVDGFKPSPYFIKLFQENLVFKFAQTISDRYRAQINKIESFKELDAFFATHPAFYSEFTGYAASKGVSGKGSNIAADRHIIEAQIRAYVGRNTPLQESAFYYYIWPLDPTLVESEKVR